MLSMKMKIQFSFFSFSFEGSILQWWELTKKKPFRLHYTKKTLLKTRYKLSQFGV